MIEWLACPACTWESTFVVLFRGGVWGGVVEHGIARATARLKKNTGES